MPSSNQFDIKAGENRDKYIRRISDILRAEIEDASERYQRAHKLHREAVTRQAQAKLEPKPAAKKPAKKAPLKDSLKKETIQAVAKTPDITKADSEPKP